MKKLLWTLGVLALVMLPYTVQAQHWITSESVDSICIGTNITLGSNSLWWDIADTLIIDVAPDPAWVTADGKPVMTKDCYDRWLDTDGKTHCQHKIRFQRVDTCYQVMPLWNRRECLKKSGTDEKVIVATNSVYWCATCRCLFRIKKEIPWVEAR